MRKPTIINSSGEKMGEFSLFCPKCGCHMIHKGELTGPDFDEDGWFHRQNFQCQDPKCLHKWSEKVVIMSGGTTHKHSL